MKILTITILIIMVVLMFIYLSFKKVKIEQNKHFEEIIELYNQGDLLKAKSELQKFTKQYPYSSKGWTFYGDVCLMLNEIDNASIGFKKGYELNNKDDRALVGLATIERLNNNLDKSIFYHEESLKINPSNTYVYTSLVLLEIKKNNYIKAVQYAEKALEIGKDKEDPVLLGNLALAYHFNNQKDKSDNYLQKLKEMEYIHLSMIQMMI